MTVTKDSVIEVIALPPEVVRLLDGFCSVTGQTRPEFIQNYLSRLPAETDPNHADMMSLVAVLVDAKTARLREELNAVCKEASSLWDMPDTPMPIWNE